MSGTGLADVAASHQTFLAFDYGLKRTGVAVGNRMLRSATPQHTIQAEGDARFVQKFARQLRGRFALPVYEVDERYSTTEALQAGARDADAASACIILEQFLRSLP